MKTPSLFWILFCTSSFIFVSCNTDEDFYIDLEPEQSEVFSGGENTSFNFSPEAFGFAAPNLTFDDRITFGVGNSFLIKAG
jgi:CxxC motif-containing protein (DUF1111 family)